MTGDTHMTFFGVWHHVWSCLPERTAPWMWRQHIPPKGRYQHMIIHSVKTQRAVIWEVPSNRPRPCPVHKIISRNVKITCAVDAAWWMCEMHLCVTEESSCQQQPKLWYIFLMHGIVGTWQNNYQVVDSSLCYFCSNFWVTHTMYGTWILE